MLIVICGPIASGKSTIARAVARLFARQGTEAAAIDLDVVYEMLDHDGAPKSSLPTWGRARRAAAALTDALLQDGVGVVVVEGDFLTPEQRTEFVTALRSSVAPVFVTVHVSSRIRRGASLAIPASSVATTSNWRKPSVVDRRRTSSSIRRRSALTKRLARSRSGHPAARA